MAENSAIAWTDHTFNPWWGCTKVSPGCKNCYAETLSKRYVERVLWGDNVQRKPMSENYWNEPLRWNRKAEKSGVRSRVFCGSMCDVFENRRELDVHRNRLFALIDKTPALDWLLLSKRNLDPMQIIPPFSWRDGLPRNVWIGTSIENQDYTGRMDGLKAIPAYTRFLSIEPILGPVVLGDLTGINWVIVGGESGPKARPADLSWFRSLRDECKAAGVAFFCKQLGGHPDKRERMEEFPEDLRIREYPSGR